MSDQENSTENQNHSDQKSGAPLGNQNAQTHGVYSFVERGPDALAPDKRSRYSELKAQFDHEPGRIEYRRELATTLAMIVELGASDIRKQAEAGRSIWTSAPTARIGTFINALIRLLDNWPREPKGNMTILEVMKGNQNESET